MFLLVVFFHWCDSALNLPSPMSVQITRTDQQCKPVQKRFHNSMVNDLAVHPNGRDIISLGDTLAWWRLTENGESW